MIKYMKPNNTQPSTSHVSQISTLGLLCMLLKSAEILSVQKKVHIVDTSVLSVCWKVQNISSSSP